MKRFAGKLLANLAVACFCLPLIAIPGWLAGHGSPLYWLAAAAACILPGTVTAVLPGRLRIPWSVVCAGLALVFLPISMAPGAVLFLLFALLSAPHIPGEEWPHAVWLTCFVLQLAILVVIYFTTRSGREGSDALLDLLKGSFILYTVLYLFHMNHANVQESMSAHSAAKPPRSVRRHNTLLTSIFLAVVLLLSGWKVLASALKTVWEWIRTVIDAVILWIVSLFPEGPAQSGAGGGGDTGMLGLFPPGEASPIWAFLEKVARVIAVLLLAGVVFLMLRQAAKALRRLWLRIRERLAAFARTTEETYEDRTESIFDWDELRRAAAEKLQRRGRRRRVRWDGLTPAEQVRQAYALFITGKKGLSPSATARRVLTDAELPATRGEQAADIYDRSRYGAGDVTPAEAGTVRTSILGGK